MAPAVVSAALVGTAFIGGTATAATPGAARQVVAAGTASASCVSAEAQESVKIRKDKKVSSTALGLFPKGAKACTVGSSQTGGSYNLCKHRDNTWTKISYRGIRGWIPYYCGAREL
ncbi:hypothetical protein AB0C96_28270 [Streptomyces sp. NPDC048506]|uniref:hypothetical protein n=1 Tax=Streptomyces sp. NPDC048506 TaxID=3155028 RepID=UPI00343AEAB8